MTKRYSRKSNPVSRRRRRQSVSGKILPPIDVRSASSFGDMAKRILSGPVTIVLVYADWCGHCHEFMPHFDAASKDGRRSIQAVKINESVLPQVNSYLNKNVNKSAKPISVDGYPSVLLLKKDGTVLTDVEAKKDTSVMKQVMSMPPPPSSSNVSSSNTRNRLAENLGMSEEGMAVTASNSLRNFDVNEGSIQSMPSSDLSMNSLTLSNSMGSNKKDTNTSMAVTPQEVKAISSLQSIQGNSASLPPNPQEDMEEGTIRREPPRPEGLMGGGSLYQALSQSAYTLAPAAVLLATAHAMRGKSRKNKRMSRRRMSRRRMSRRRPSKK